jgi:hypothetical protein
MSPKQQNAEVWVLAGKSGTGKTQWIQNRKLSLASICLNFAVHEGFAGKLVIDRFAKSGIKAISNVVLCFDVSASGCLAPFDRFLHHLLALGLIIDDEGVISFAILPGIQLDVFVELPEIAAEYGACEGSAADSGSNWPPKDDSEWSATQHPLLRLLPALVGAVARDHYISIRESKPFSSGHKARRVANFLLFARNGQLFENYEHDLDLPAPEIRNILDDELFKKYHVSTTKRLRTFLINLLYDRLTYLLKMILHVRTLQHDG